MKRANSAYYGVVHKSFFDNKKTYQVDDIVKDMAKYKTLAQEQRSWDILEELKQDDSELFMLDCFCLFLRLLHFDHQLICIVNNVIITLHFTEINWFHAQGILKTLDDDRHELAHPLRDQNEFLNKEVLRCLDILQEEKYISPREKEILDGYAKEARRLSRPCRGAPFQTTSNGRNQYRNDPFAAVPHKRKPAYKFR